MNNNGTWGIHNATKWNEINRGKNKNRIHKADGKIMLNKLISNDNS